MQPSRFAEGHSVSKVFFVVLLSLLSGWTDGSVSQCFTFYSKGLFGETSAACQDSCPYRATCDNDEERSTCVQTAEDCAKLLPRGQLISGWINYSNGDSIPNNTCQSCMVNGCSRCTGGANGTVVCETCDGHFELDGEGGCEWKEKYWSYVFYLVIGMCFLLGFWVMTDFARAECAKTTNTDAVERGLIMRRRSKVLMKRKIDGSSEDALDRAPLLTNLFKVSSSEIGGPGVVLFMNWFLFVIVLSLWLALGAIIFAPSGDDNLDHYDPCRQQSVSSEGKLKLEQPGVDGTIGPYRAWSQWNFCGSVVLTIAFFFYQEKKWSAIVKDWQRPSLQEYCIELSNVPHGLTDKRQIRKLLGDWMDRLLLDASGIRHISVAYNIPPGMQGRIDDLLDKHLMEIASERSKRVFRHDVSDLDDETVKDAGPFWIQVASHVLLETPLDLRCSRCCRSARVGDSGAEGAAMVEGKGVGGGSFGGGGAAGGGGDAIGPGDQVRQMLDSLQGSGYVYVSMGTEALAEGVASMGVARLDGVDGNIRIRKSSLGPNMIRWYDYAHMPLRRRILRIAKATGVLLVVLIIWLAVFAWYLTFELVTRGNTSYSREFMSTCVVGLMVPLGNAVFGITIEIQTETLGFRDEENMRLCRLILNVLLNAVANFGEIYLVHKKVYDPTGWKIMDLPWEFQEAFQPFHLDPYVRQFQTLLLEMLWPFGLLAPILLIPCVETIMPFLLGRLRVKRDARMTSADAERALKPVPIDIIGNYSDMLINIFLVAAIFWISPGYYHVTLWLAVALWAALQCCVLHMNILRWQAHGYVGGKETHECTSLLLGIPLSVMAATMEKQLDSDHTGWLGIFLYLFAHFTFLQYVLPSFFSHHVSMGTRYDDMMQDENAPMVNYRNTNPIEVLQAVYQPDPSFGIDREPLVFYRHDKWYLQEGCRATRFEGEEDLKEAVVKMRKIEGGNGTPSSTLGTGINVTGTSSTRKRCVPANTGDVCVIGKGIRLGATWAQRFPWLARGDD